jgi:hypothetical protein
MSLAHADRFRWRAVYANGEVLPQVNEDGSKNSYYDIDHSRLVFFEMWEGGHKVLSLRVGKNDRLIWRRRIERTPTEIKEVCHLIGKQQTVSGKNFQGLIALFESDGTVEVADKFDENNPWFFPIIKHEREEWEFENVK